MRDQVRRGFVLKFTKIEGESPYFVAVVAVGVTLDEFLETEKRSTPDLTSDPGEYLADTGLRLLYLDRGRRYDASWGFFVPVTISAGSLRSFFAKEDRVFFGQLLLETGMLGWHEDYLRQLTCWPVIETRLAPLPAE